MDWRCLQILSDQNGVREWIIWYGISGIATALALSRYSHTIQQHQRYPCPALEQQQHWFLQYSHDQSIKDGIAYMKKRLCGENSYPKLKKK
ncbi:hypothetical protein WAI453_011518 [Rhynchosporium graminicola]